jgi:hypothetical protein
MKFVGCGDYFILRPVEEKSSHVDEEELERDYENIPEPHRPIEYHADTIVFGEKWARQTVELGRVVRLIEWPENAPLPDWPE